MYTNAEQTAPAAVASLIRSKADALAIFEVVRDHAEVKGVGLPQCDRIRESLETWDGPSFDNLSVEEVVRHCDRLDTLTRPRCDMMELATFRVALFALVHAAERQAGVAVKNATPHNAKL